MSGAPVRLELEILTSAERWGCATPVGNHWHLVVLSDDEEIVLGVGSESSVVVDGHVDDDRGPVWEAEKVPEHSLER